jgi:hypothetical protein
MPGHGQQLPRRRTRHYQATHSSKHRPKPRFVGSTREGGHGEYTPRSIGKREAKGRADHAARRDRGGLELWWVNSAYGLGTREPDLTENNHGKKGGTEHLNLTGGRCADCLASVNGGLASIFTTANSARRGCDAQFATAPRRTTERKKATSVWVCYGVRLSFSHFRDTMAARGNRATRMPSKLK